MDCLEQDARLETILEDATSCVELNDIELTIAGGGCGGTVFH
jgi:hypothetical protein